MAEVSTTRSFWDGFSKVELENDGFMAAGLTRDRLDLAHKIGNLFDTHVTGALETGKALCQREACELKGIIERDDTGHASSAVYTCPIYSPACQEIARIAAHQTVGFVEIIGRNLSEDIEEQAKVGVRK